MLEVASTVVLDGDKVLVLKRIDENVWNFPGGKVENEEQIPEAAARELLEEANIKVNPEDLISLGFLHSDEIIIYFFITNSFSGNVKINEESSDHDWVNIYELDKLKFVGEGKISPYLKETIVVFYEENNE